MAEEMTILTQSLIVASSSTFHQIGDLGRGRSMKVNFVFADSAQAEYWPTFHCSCVCV